MKLIPYFMIMIGGIMIYAGINESNPMAVLKGVLGGTGIPTKTVPDDAHPTGAPLDRTSNTTPTSSDPAVPGSNQTRRIDN